MFILYRLLTFSVRMIFYDILKSPALQVIFMLCVFPNVIENSTVGFLQPQHFIWLSYAPLVIHTHMTLGPNVACEDNSISHTYTLFYKIKF